MRKIAGEFERPLAELEDKIAALALHPDTPAKAKKLEKMESELAKKRQSVFANLKPGERTLLARHPNRPYSLDYFSRMFTDFTEFHGDRHFRDDPAIITGFAMFRGEPVCVIGQQKGRNTKEKIHHNFGMAHPEAYRKAIRIMRLADKFQRPILSFIDTQGAFPGIGAEERGQAEAIAYNLKAMGQLTVPIIATVIGEGGSGGALGIAIGNRVNILEHSYYSVITPEGCAAILWRDAIHADKAAAAMKITPDNLKKLRIVDQIIAEPPGGAHIDPDTMAASISDQIAIDLEELSKLSADELLEDRFMKFRQIGEFIEELS